MMTIPEEEPTQPLGIEGAKSRLAAAEKWVKTSNDLLTFAQAQAEQSQKELRSKNGLNFLLLLHPFSIHFPSPNTPLLCHRRQRTFRTVGAGRHRG